MGGREGQTDQPQLPKPESRTEGRSEKQRKGPSGRLPGRERTGGGAGRGRAGPGRPAALTSALSDGLSTAIFCHGSASCASGIFPPGPPPSPPPPSPPAPRPAPLRRRPSPTAEAAAAAAAATAAARERARRRHRPSNAARPAGDARALSESLAPLPGTGSRPFLPLSFRRRDYSSAPPAGSRARSQQNSGPRALPHFRSQHGA